MQFNFRLFYLCILKLFLNDHNWEYLSKDTRDHNIRKIDLKKNKLAFEKKKKRAEKIKNSNY